MTRLDGEHYATCVSVSVGVPVGYSLYGAAQGRIVNENKTKTLHRVRQSTHSECHRRCRGSRRLLLRAIFTRWPTTTIEQRWCFCWGGSGVRSRSRRQSAGARPEGYCTELFEELVEGDSFRELHVQ